MLDTRMIPLERYMTAPEECAMVVRRELPRTPARWERILGFITTAAVSGRNVRGLSVAAAASVTLILFGAPLLTPWILCVGAAHYAAAIVVSSVRAARAERAQGPLALPIEPEVQPHEVAFPDLRATYHDILRIHEDIRCSLVAAERIQQSMGVVFDRCGEVVQAAGRLARVANPMKRYLEQHGPGEVKGELQRLASSADVATDRQAKGLYQSAAAARGRQLGTLFEIQHLRDRIRARLEFIGASLQSVSALVIKLEVLDLEQVELAGDTMAEQLGSLSDELALLESMIEEDV